MPFALSLFCQLSAKRTSFISQQFILFTLTTDWATEKWQNRIVFTHATIDLKNICSLWWIVLFLVISRRHENSLNFSEFNEFICDRFYSQYFFLFIPLSVLLLRSFSFGSIPMWNNNNRHAMRNVIRFICLAKSNRMPSILYCCFLSLGMFVFAFFFLLVFLQTILFSFVVRHSFNPQIFFFHSHRHRSSIIFTCFSIRIMSIFCCTLHFFCASECVTEWKMETVKIQIMHFYWTFNSRFWFLFVFVVHCALHQFKSFQ